MVSLDMRRSPLLVVPFFRLSISVLPDVDAVEAKSSSPTLSTIVPLPLLNLVLELDVVEAVESFVLALLLFTLASKASSPDDVVEFPLSLIRCSFVLKKSIVL